MESLIFDVDGTLWDAVALVAEGWNDGLQSMGFAPHCTEQSIRPLFGKTMTEIAQVVVPGVPQEQAMEGILGDEVRPGEVVVIRYEGPKGGPGMQEMLYPTSYLKSKRLDKVCALVTDGRFSGGTSGLSIGHVSPEAAAGGEIAIVHTGDPIEIDIPNRSIRLLVDEREIAARKAAVKRYAPAARERRVPTSLRAYALLVSSADKGAVRLIDTPDNA